MALFDDRLQGASNANAVTTHNSGILLARFIEKERLEGLAVFRAKFKYMADLDGSLHFEGLAAFSARFTCLHHAQVRPVCFRNVALNRDVPQMETIFVGASGHATAITKTFIRKNLELGDADCAEAARMRPKDRKNLLSFTGPKICRAEHSGQLGFVQLIVTPQQNQHRLALGDVNKRLDLAL